MSNPTSGLIFLGHRLPTFMTWCAPLRLCQFYEATHYKLIPRL